MGRWRVGTRFGMGAKRKDRGGYTQRLDEESTAGQQAGFSIVCRALLRPGGTEHNPHLSSYPKAKALLDGAGQSVQRRQERARASPLKAIIRAYWIQSAGRG